MGRLDLPDKVRDEDRDTDCHSDIYHCLTAITLALEAHLGQGSRPSDIQMESMVAAAQAALSA